MGLKKKRLDGSAVYRAPFLLYFWMFATDMESYDKGAIPDRSIDRIREKQLQVLLIDDDDMFREAMAMSLSEIYGALVTQARTGIDAIKAHEAGNSYDLIFLDIMMQPINGLQTFQEIRNIKSDSSIVMMSAHTNSPEWVRSQDLGIEVISKPIDEQALFNILSDYAK